MAQRRLWVDRREDGTFVAHSSDGAELVFGHGEGIFNPGDLAKIAVAACGELSSASVVERALGQNKGATIEVSGDYDETNDRYNSFSEKVSVDASGTSMSQADADKLAKRVERHIEADCTVAHTYRQATPVDISIDVRR
jgi:uncharacterized OsmC-like protein